MLRALALTTLLVLSGCTHLNRPAATTGPTERVPTRSAEIVDITGIGDVKIGSTRAEISEHLHTQLPGCNTQLASHPQGSLVFTSDDIFVLIWFEAPLRTPDGVTTGTSVSMIKTAYPQATELRAPEGSYRFDGLIATSGEHGYLFLHDGRTVRKAIAGYVDYLHRLFNTGFGVC